MVWLEASHGWTLNAVSCRITIYLQEALLSDSSLQQQSHRLECLHSLIPYLSSSQLLALQHKTANRMAHIGTAGPPPPLPPSLRHTQTIHCRFNSSMIQDMCFASACQGNWHEMLWWPTIWVLLILWQLRDKFCDTMRTKHPSSFCSSNHCTSRPLSYCSELVIKCPLKGHCYWKGRCLYATKVDIYWDCKSFW